MFRCPFCDHEIKVAVIPFPIGRQPESKARSHAEALSTRRRVDTNRELPGNETATGQQR